MPIQPRPTAETVRLLPKVRYFMLKFLLICKNTFQPCGVIVHPAAIRAKAVGPAIQHDASGGNAHIPNHIILLLELAVGSAEVFSTVALSTGSGIFCSMAVRE